MANTTVKDISAAAAYKQVSEAPQDREARDCSDIKVGQCVRQGDVYITRIRKEDAKGLEENKTKAGRQLAPGTELGSQHVAQAPSRIYKTNGEPRGVKLDTFPEDIDTSALVGPVIVSDKEFEVTHPTHPNCRLPPGAYQVSYQLDAKTRRRVQD